MLNVGFLDGTVLFAYCRLFSSKLPASKKMLHLHKLVLNVDEIRRVRFSFTTSTFKTNQVNLTTSVYQHMICQ